LVAGAIEANRETVTAGHTDEPASAIVAIITEMGFQRPQPGMRSRRGAGAKAAVRPRGATEPPASAGPLYGLRWGVSRLRVPAVLARPSHQLGVIVKQFTFENCEQT